MTVIYYPCLKKRSSKMGNDSKNYKFETKAIHAACNPDKETGACVTPIYHSSAYAFTDTTNAANRFSLKEEGTIYSRVTNPTVSALENKIAALEGGTGATCTASGLGASFLLFTALMGHGDEFVTSCKIYGGTSSQFRDTFPRAFNWTPHFVDPNDPENFKKAITDKTKLIFIESLSNPEGVIPDFDEIARIADDAGIPLVVDNTVPTPYLFRPFDHGASIITHSTTKYLNGHGNSMGGAIVDGGKFDWNKHKDKYPAIATPDKSYKDMIFSEQFPDNPLAMHNHAVGLRDLGVTQQPMNAYLTLTGMETLALRMERHCENALKIAEYLAGHEAVSWVSHPGLKDSPYYNKAQKYMRNGWGGALFTFGAKGGYEAGIALVENTKIFSNVANIGDTRSLICHPCSTTHAQLNDEQKEMAGVGPDVVRLSIGIENAEDLIADLDQALNSACSIAA
jgi:O-acetylhomoserine (thiol)-lyase